ncbi:MAG: FGGY family carbohydrate kinase, partial [Eubacteriales bacterium]|nr:FGGY family carbohydrate kinase [Eubacteriales bacterium]
MGGVSGIANTYLAAVDIGTSGVKSMLFDEKGNVAGSGCQEVYCTYPRANWVVQDPVMLRDAAFATLRIAKEESGIKASDIVALSFSAQRSSVIFIDEHEEPIKMIPWQDNRAIAEVDIIRSTIDENEYYDVTGTPPCETWILP